jgi:hypothetical protein
MVWREGRCSDNHGQGRRPAQALIERKGKRFFFEKKKQKTFVMLSRAGAAVRSIRSKVFWFFFSKRTCFLRMSWHRS